jgi:hypothetical protein
LRFPGRLPAGRFERPAADLDDRSGLLRRGDELGRRDQPPFRVLPPDEGLEAADLPGSRVDDRLVREPELLQSQGLRELDLECESLDCDVAQRRVEDRDAAFPLGLRAVHRDVGVAEQ